MDCSYAAARGGIEDVDGHHFDAGLHAEVQLIVTDDVGFNASVLEAQKPNEFLADLSMPWRASHAAGF